MSFLASAFPDALSDNPRKFSQLSHPESSAHYTPSDEDNIIIITSPDNPSTSASTVETNEEPYISRMEMLAQIRGLERVRLF